MTNLREIDYERKEVQDYFFLNYPSMLVKNGEIERFTHILLNISFLAKKISRYGLQAVLDDFSFPFVKENNKLQTLRQIILQTQDQLSFSNSEQDSFGTLHSLLTHNPAFIEVVAREEFSKNVSLPILTAYHPIINLPNSGDIIPRQIIKTEDRIGLLIYVRSIAIADDGNFLAINNSLYKVDIWNLETQQKHLEIFLVGNITCLNFSPDGRKLLVSAKKSKDEWEGEESDFVVVWDIHSNQELLRMEGHNQSINKSFFSKDGKFIISASDDKTILIWDAETGKINKRLDDVIPIKDCVYSEAQKMIYSVSDDEKIRVWDTDSGRQAFLVNEQKGKIKKCSITSDGELLSVINENGSINIWDTVKKIEIATFFVKNIWAIDSAISPDKKFVLSIFSDHSIRTWEMLSGKLRATLSYSYIAPKFCLINAHNDCLITFKDGLVYIWDANSLFGLEGIHFPDKEMFVHNILNEGRNNATSFIPKGIKSCHLVSSNEFIAIDRDNKIKIWDSESGQISQVFDESKDENLCVPSKSRKSSFILVSISTSYPTNDQLESLLKIWDRIDLSARIIVLPTQSATDSPRTCDISNDNKFCIIGYSQGLIELRSLPDGDLKYQIYGHPRDPEEAELYKVPLHHDIRRCLIAPDNSFFASIAQYDPHIMIWDAESGDLLQKLQVDSLQEYLFISFTNDGKYLLAIGTNRKPIGTPEDQFLQSWDVQGFKEVAQIHLGKGLEISNCSIEAEGAFIALTQFNGQINIWDIRTGKRIVASKVSDSLYSCAWSTEKVLMVGGQKGAYFLWLITDEKQWRRFGRGIFDTGYQPTLHFFGDNSTTEKTYTSLLYDHKHVFSTDLKVLIESNANDKKAIVESVLYKVDRDIVSRIAESAVIYNNAAIKLALLQELKAARALFEKVGDLELSSLNEVDKGIVLFNKGCVELLLHNYAEAKPYYEHCLKIFEVNKIKSWQAKILEQFAAISDHFHDYQTSVDLYSAAIPLYEKSRNWNNAVELKAKISLVYKHLNDQDRAIQYMTEYFTERKN